MGLETCLVVRTQIKYAVLGCEVLTLANSKYTSGIVINVYLLVVQTVSAPVVILIPIHLSVLD